MAQGGYSEVKEKEEEKDESEGNGDCKNKREKDVCIVDARRKII